MLRFVCCMLFADRHLSCSTEFRLLPENFLKGNAMKVFLPFKQYK